MLIHLSIDNFAIADHLECELHPGMSVLTGETGAGKSILLDALGLALGGRADSAAVRKGANRADVHATFDVRAMSAVRQWLRERDLAAEDECLLRRVVTSEGRSRAYINGQPVTLPDLRAIGEQLVDIHGQHAHQSLLRKPHQRQLLDGFANAAEGAEKVRELAQRHQALQTRLEGALTRRDELDAREQLLRYQVEELDALALGDDELAELESEQRDLANGEQILRNSQQALAFCKEGEINVVSILQQALRVLQETGCRQGPVVEAEQMLASAAIQVDEAARELQHYLDDFELDPARLQDVESRLSAIYEIARKHRIPPDQLQSLHRDLQAELRNLVEGGGNIEQMEAELQAIVKDYTAAARTLTACRQRAAASLRQQVEKQLKQLAMGACRFLVQLTPREPDLLHPNGAEEVEFLISTNPGSDPQPLQRVASGGELSRISLAIQVATAQSSATATLVFDEVDVGIGGATAEVVGNLLRQLGSRTQVLCVTHQPQVASKGHNHFKVEKLTSKSSVRVTLEPLSNEARIEEIARMLGGLTITEQSRAHAREMVTITD